MDIILNMRAILFGVVCAVVVGVGGMAVAGDSAPTNPVVRPGMDMSNPSMGSDGKRYTDYAEDQTMEMLDAIDRDHPVHTPF